MENENNEEIPLRVTNKSYAESQNTTDNDPDTGKAVDLLGEEYGSSSSIQDNSVDNKSDMLSGPSLPDRIFRTIAIDAAYFCAWKLGTTHDCGDKEALHLGIIGPSQLDLQALTHTSTSQISMIYTVRSVMAIIGSLAMGPILDRTNRYITVAVSLLLSSIFTTAGPWSRSLPVVLFTLGVPEFFGCALGMGSHLLTVDIWKKKAGPFLQLLNFISVSGFTVAPLLVQPFLKEIESAEDDDSGCVKSLKSGKVTVSINNRSTLASDSYELVTHATTALHEEYVIYITYLIVGIYGVIIFSIFVVIIIKDRERKKYKSGGEVEDNEEENSNDKKTDKNYSQSQLYLIYFIYFWMILFYGGIEVSFPGQITTFVFKELCWRKSDGARLASLVMGSNALFTLLGIYISTKVRPVILIGIDVVCVLISLLLLTLLVDKYNNAIWICAALLGAASATIMPSAYTWANDTFEITWLFNSAFWCGFFTGFMISNLTGFLMDTLGLMWYCYTMLLCSILVVLLFALLATLINKGSCVAKKRIKTNRS